MASNVIKCRLLVEDLVHPNQPHVINFSSIKIMPVGTRKQWIEAILKAQRIVMAEQGEEHDAFQDYLLRINGTIETSTSSTDPDAENSTIDYRPLSEVIDAFTLGAGAKEEKSAYNLISSDDSHHSSGSENLPVLHRGDMIDNMNGLGATLGRVTYGCLRATAKAQRSSKFNIYNILQQTGKH